MKKTEELVSKLIIDNSHAILEAEKGSKSSKAAWEAAVQGASADLDLKIAEEKGNIELLRAKLSFASEYL